MRSWFDAMSMHLEPISHPPFLNKDDWKSWALRIVVSPKISAMNPPTPDQYDDWKAWAQSFNSAMSTAGY